MMQFTKATAHQARLRLALIGPSGSGKTYTALNTAQHLGSKVAVIDTERGSASKYASLFGFDVLELQSFAPATYVQAIQAADAAGYDVLVIDSLSHAWMGKDGALEMKDAATARDPRRDSFGAWRQVTPAHNAMVDAILQSTAHVIVTMRTKTEYVIEKDERTGKTSPRKVGLAPIQRDGLEYEFDVVGDMDKATLVVSKTRCPTLADAVIPKPGKELADTLRGWLGQGEPRVVQSAQLVNQSPAPAPTPTVQTHDGPCGICKVVGTLGPENWCVDVNACNGRKAAILAAAQATNGHAPPDDDEPAAPHTDATLAADRAAQFAADLQADLDKQQVRFPRNAPGMQEFIKLVELPRPNGLGLDADARKDALGGKSVNKYMTDQGWQDDPAALDRVWAELERKVLATEAAEVAATE